MYVIRVVTSYELNDDWLMDCWIYLTPDPLGWFPPFPFPCFLSRFALRSSKFFFLSSSVGSVGFHYKIQIKFLQFNSIQFNNKLKNHKKYSRCNSSCAQSTSCTHLRSCSVCLDTCHCRNQLQQSTSFVSLSHCVCSFGWCGCDLNFEEGRLFIGGNSSGESVTRILQVIP